MSEQLSAYLPLQELGESIALNANPDKKPRPCRKCGMLWTPGHWNFHDLCNKCFGEFDNQKMNGRSYNLHLMLFGEKDKDHNPKPEFYSESMEEWLAHISENAQPSLVIEKEKPQ